MAVQRKRTLLAWKKKSGGEGKRDASTRMGKATCKKKKALLPRVEKRGRKQKRGGGEGEPHKVSVDDPQRGESRQI